MSQLVHILLSFITGMALGTIYFSGLWRTVKKLPDVGRPYASLLWSFVLRASLVLAGFYMAMGSAWERLAAALLGFILMREILVRRLGRNTS